MLTRTTNQVTYQPLTTTKPTDRWQIPPTPLSALFCST